MAATEGLIGKSPMDYNISSVLQTPRPVGPCTRTAPMLKLWSHTKNFTIFNTFSTQKSGVKKVSGRS